MPRIVAKRTREGEPEAKRRRHEEGEGGFIHRPGKPKQPVTPLAIRRFHAAEALKQAQFALLKATEQVTRRDDPRLVQAAEQVTNSKIQIRAMDEATRAMNEATQAMNEATRAMNEAAQGLCGAPRRQRISVAPE